MTFLKLAGRITSFIVCCALGPAASALTDHTLTNNLGVQVKFVQQGSATPTSNLWVTSIKSLGAQTITLEQGRPLWIVEMKQWPATSYYNDLSVLPQNLPLSSVNKVVAGGTSTLTATWGPAFVPLPAEWNPTPSGWPSPPNLPRMKVIATWVLPDNSDVVSATISVQILNTAVTPYKLWLTRYPRVAVGCLDADAELDGSDRLAMGRIGGELYGDPIHYFDHTSGPLQLTQNPDHVNATISQDSIDPGTLSIPASSYYDTETGIGLYHSNDDHEGYIKGIYWTQDGDLGTNGSLLVQTVQYATGNIFQATSYTSPYKVQFAALDQGDWIAAAHKYRSTWRDFSEYPGPLGSPDNLLVSPELKSTPVALWLDSGDGYCVNSTDVEKQFNQTQAQADLDGIAAFMGDVGTPMDIPLVYMNRFAVDPPHEIFLGPYGSEYLQSDDMLDVHDLIINAELDGHRTLIHGISEKHFFPSLPAGGGDPEICDELLYTECNYCDFDDANIQDMFLHNSLIKTPGAASGPAPCSKGLGDVDGGWPGWWARINAEFTNQLRSKGGLGWCSPNPTAGWCFSTSHDHDPGFGNFLAQGWLDILAETAAGVQTTTTFARTMETSVALFSQAAGIQNAWNFDVGYDYGHFALNEYWYFHDAPIWRIPMMQMAIDNATYASVYSPWTLSYPFVEPHVAQNIAVFNEFPAIPGALACWSMAERVLAYQSLVYLNNEYMVDIDDFNNPGTDIVKNAAADTFTYYRGLAKFLMGAQPESLIEYHTGALERSPHVSIVGIPQPSFSLSWDTIEDHFEVLEAGVHTLLGEEEDVAVDWAKYQPMKYGLSYNNPYLTFFMPVGPEAEPNYLPNGMYHHADLTEKSLAFFITNPWGVKNGTKEINPFTFNYDSPNSSPSTTYDYEFLFDPADYEGFETPFDAFVAVYDVDGSVASSSSLLSNTVPTTFSGTLAPHQSAAWVFKKHP